MAYCTKAVPCRCAWRAGGRAEQRGSTKVAPRTTPCARRTAMLVRLRQRPAVARPPAHPAGSRRTRTARRQPAQRRPPPPRPAAFTPPARRPCARAWRRQVGRSRRTRPSIRLSGSSPRTWATCRRSTPLGPRRWTGLQPQRRRTRSSAFRGSRRTRRRQDPPRCPPATQHAGRPWNGRRRPAGPSTSPAAVIESPLGETDASGASLGWRRCRWAAPHTGPRAGRAGRGHGGRRGGGPVQDGRFIGGCGNRRRPRRRQTGLASERRMAGATRTKTPPLPHGTPAAGQAGPAAHSETKADRAGRHPCRRLRPRRRRRAPSPSRSQGLA